MPLKKMIDSLPPTGTKKDIPVVFHEPHVETGFRLTHQPWHYYPLSLFQRHNECLNVWTHLVGCLIAMSRLYEVVIKFDAFNDPWMYPMLAGSLTMITMYMCSFMAHTFHNKSEQMHYTCFFVDYAGIGTYGLGSTMIHYYYCTDKHLIGSFCHKHSISVAVALAVITCLFCSHSKTKYSRPYPFARKIWQLSSVLSIYVWLIIPVVHRLVYVAFHPADNEWDASLTHHATQMAWFFAAGFFFGSDIPQRFFPGKCDFLFHGHQIFHVCIMFTNLKQIDAMSFDIISRMDEIKTWEEVPTLWNTFGPVLLAMFLNAVVIAVFHQRAKQRIQREAKERAVGDADNFKEKLN